MSGFRPGQNYFIENDSSFGFLLEALADHKIVTIEYLVQPNSLEIIVTDISVYHICLKCRKCYVLAWSSMHQNVQSFAAGQIFSIRTTDRHYEIPKDFSSKQYYKNAWLVDPENGQDWEIELIFSLQAAHLVEKKPWHKTQKSRRLPDGTLKVQFTVSGLHEIATWILGHGSHIKVVSPPELKQMVLDQTHATINNYESENMKNNETV